MTIHSTKSPFTYEYRFVSVCGLERKHAHSASGGGNLGNGLYAAPPKLWAAVKPEDFLAMGWEELEHVAHVIRDASRPSSPILPQREAAE